MSKSENTVKVARAKGRQTRTWVGKRPLARVRAYPSQHVESFTADLPPGTIAGGDWPERFEHGVLLFHGDNKDVLAHLLANGFRGKVKLIYIDPPFDSGADYVRKVQLRGPKGTTRIDAEVFRVALSDVPARKQDLVSGQYELAAPRAGATVAVKVIDMLGEETVVAAVP